MTGSGPAIDPARLVQEKRASDVRRMFNAIAPRYDLANHLLSVGIDHLWRSQARRELRRMLAVPQPRILDVCCGTGDLCRELSRLGPVVGVDFARDMLMLGGMKFARRPAPHPVLFAEGDGLALPFRHQSFDAVTAAFGVRNFENLSSGLREMVRILRRGGALAILEFSKPDCPVVAAGFGFYFRRVLPFLGGCITGHRSAYQYLPASVDSFINPRRMLEELSRMGLTDVRDRKLSGGIARLYLARKP